MIKIVSDSTCDLSDELVKRYDISILPLHILLGDKEYRDKVEITPDEIYAWADKNKTTPKTSAPSIEDVKKVYRQLLEGGNEIIVFSIASGMSTSHNILRLVAEDIHETERISVVDSANLSTGIGHLVIKAAEMAAAGKSRKEILGEIERLKPLVRASFVVDTLTYLYRGGRCSAVSAMAGSVLKIHPKIVVENGTMRPDKKYRGKLDLAIINYVDDMREELLKADADRVFITHSGCKPETVELVREHLKKLGRFTEIIETRAGGVVSSHCGWGTLGVLFIAG